MYCNNYNANTQPKVQFAVAFPADYCHTTWQAFAQALMEALAGVLPDNYSTFLISDSTPAASDRDKVWVSVDPSNCRPIGVKLYLNGSWVDIGANVFYGVDVSSVDNLIQVDATTPVVNWAQTGHVFFVKFARANDGAATITVKSNGTAFYSAIPVRKWNNQPLAALDYIAGMVGVFVYDGVTNTMRLTNPVTAGVGGGSSSGGGSGHNLSFDDDVNEDGIPDKWRIFTSSASFSGAVGEAETAPASGTPAYVLDPAGVHGGKCIKFNVINGVGNGGGFIQTEGHIEVVANQIQEFSWWVKTDADAISNRVEVLWYDADKVFISKTELWANSASNPNGAWFQHGGIAQSPSTAKFCRVRLYAGVSGTTVGGTVWFDDFRFQAPAFTRRIAYTAAGTYTLRIPLGKFQAKFTVVAGGGGGGGVGTSHGATPVSAGGGGGGGTRIFYAPTFGEAIYAITIGAGGAGGSTAPTDGSAGSNSVITVLNPAASTVTAVTASGGAGGNRTNSAANATGGAGGTGSVTGSDWSVSIPGTDGRPSSSTLTTPAVGHGGVSSVGAGGSPAYGTTTAIGNGVAYGGGGAGGAHSSTSVAAAGADGAPGVIIVEYV